MYLWTDYVAKGFFIFRDPADGRIQGAKGPFSHAGSGFFPSARKTMLVHPWNSHSHLQKLEIEIHSTSLTDFNSWIAEAELGAVPNEFHATEADFTAYIQHIKDAIAAGTIQKTVAARSFARDLGTKPILEVFLKACELYPTAFVHLMYHPQEGMWLGASPEILLSVKGDMATTMALAGTLRNHSENWTGKEMEEQSIIGNYIEEVLTRHHCTFAHEALTTTQAGPLQHLLTRYHFTATHNKIASLIEDLHPTPAVGGYPKHAALDLIAKHENLNRGLYTGWLGWAEGDELQTWVNLRCGRVYNNGMVLYAGCGINAGSDAAKEWLETEAKMGVIGRCLDS